MSKLPTFSLTALYEALNSARQDRGLTWAAAVREMSEPFTSNGSRPLAVSTVVGLRTKPRGEGDGILQMIRWLGRTPEGFIDGAAPDAGAPLPAVGPEQVLRINTRRLHSALNLKRTALGVTWAQAAAEMGGGISAGSLMNLSNGGRMGFPQVMRMTGWLGLPLARFTRITSR